MTEREILRRWALAALVKKAAEGSGNSLLSHAITGGSGIAGAGLGAWCLGY